MRWMDNRDNLVEYVGRNKDEDRTSADSSNKTLRQG